MPNNLVKTKRDEEKWDKAKALAEEQGHKEEYDYIVGIYRRMCPDAEFKGKPDHCKESGALLDELRRLTEQRTDVNEYLDAVLVEAHELRTSHRQDERLMTQFHPDVRRVATELVRLGHKAPELREHLRPILTSLRGSTKDY